MDLWATMQCVTRPTAPPDRPVRPGARLSRRWLLTNTAVLAAACALAGPGMAAGDEPAAAGVLIAVCFFGPLRAASALLELYLVRQWQHTGIVISHAVGALFGAMLGTSPPATLKPGDAESIAGWALGVFGYVLVTLGALCITAAVAAVRTWRRGGTPPEPAARRSWSLSSLSALFWFNTVFLLAVALLIAPSMAAQENSDLTSGFFGGLVVGVVLRLPGAWAEWWLTGRRHHRTVYGTHLGAGALTALIGTSMYFWPTPGTSSAPADTVGSAIGVYLILSSLVLLLAVAVLAAIARLRRRGRPAPPATPAGPVERLPVPAVDAGPTLAWPTQQFRAAPQPPPATYRATARVPPPPAVPSPWRSPAEPVTEPLARPVTEPLPQPMTAPPPEPAPTTPAGAGHTPPENRTERARNEIAVALGVVVGLASLVQGYDSTDPFRTVVAALAVGLLGLAILYGTTIRR